MAYLLALITLLAGLWVSPALAGPVDTAIPSNPCAAPNGDLKIQFVANDVATDSGGVACPIAGSGCTETMIVCYNTGATGGNPIDIVVELFDATGALVTPAVPFVSACNIQPGASASFTTNLFPGQSPYQGTVVSATSHLVPPGSLRVLSSSKKIACDASLIDVQGYVVYGFASPLWSKDITVTRGGNGQKGD
jgi:hypothetical protein